MMEEKVVPVERLYVIVPQSVQVEIPAGELGIWEYLPRIQSTLMEPGRLMAQVRHVGAKLAYDMAADNVPWRDITTIVLSVRNSKELEKVTTELEEVVYNDSNLFSAYLTEYSDINPEFYGTNDRVHTATIVGPVPSSETLDSVIGHLPLYGKEI